MSAHEKPVPHPQQHQPGRQTAMDPAPQGFMRRYKPAGKLMGKRALVSGGDSGIGRAVAIGYAKEGADVAVIYLEEDNDAITTRRCVEREGRHCVLIKGDLADKNFCFAAVERAVAELGGLDVLVNNAGEQHVQEDFTDIPADQLERTFRTNIFSVFYLTQAALRYLGAGGAIINTTSITAYQGHPLLMDYASTKGAILSLTRALAQSLAKQGIRVNGVAPGPIWTPLIPASFTAEQVDEFGKNTPLGRPGQPDEVAPAYIFLASEDASYITGQVIHPNGGEMVNG